MASEMESASTKAPGLKQAFEDFLNTRSRAPSESTIYSTFSKADSFSSTATSPPNFEKDDEIQEIDKATFEANIGADLEEIDRATFEANTGHIKPPTYEQATGEVNIINGSTLGGSDPLHAMVQASGSEPKWWVEERHREDRHRKKRKLAHHLDTRSIFVPTYFDMLPYSPQNILCSGLDMECEPETCESFWDKVSNAWEISMRYETVDERRDAFGDQFGEGELDTPSRFNDELSVL